VIDLDELERLARAGLAAEELEEAQARALELDELLTWPAVLALVGELRAAREVVVKADAVADAVTRFGPLTVDGVDVGAAYLAARDAYDRAVSR
jgi:hypothetical protein